MQFPFTQSIYEPGVEHDPAQHSFRFFKNNFFFKSQQDDIVKLIPYVPISRSTEYLKFFQNNQQILQFVPWVSLLLPIALIKKKSWLKFIFGGCLYLSTQTALYFIKNYLVEECYFQNYERIRRYKRNGRFEELEWFYHGQPNQNLK